MSKVTIIVGNEQLLYNNETGYHLNIDDGELVLTLHEVDDTVPPVELPETPESEFRTFWVTTSLLNVREEPSTSANIVGKLKYGTFITCEESSQVNGGWIWYKRLDGSYVASMRENGSNVLMREVTSEYFTLNIPYFSQLTNAPDPYECGQASVLMWIHWTNPSSTLTVPEIYDRNPGLTTAYELQALALEENIDSTPLTIAKDKTTLFNSLKNYLIEERSVILLVNYGRLKFPVHLSSNLDFLHWFVVVGYAGEDTIIVNDPLWINKDGSDLPIHIETLVDALITNDTNALIFNNYNKE